METYSIIEGILVSLATLVRGGEEQHKKMKEGIK